MLSFAVHAGHLSQQSHTHDAAGAIFDVEPTCPPRRSCVASDARRRGQISLVLKHKNMDTPSAIGTWVERLTRFATLLHLLPQPGHRQQTRDKHGPALAGHGAEAVYGAITLAMSSLPKQLRRSLRWRTPAEAFDDLDRLTPNEMYLATLPALEMAA